MGRDYHCVVAFGHIVVIPRGDMDGDDFLFNVLEPLHGQLEKKGLLCLWGDDDDLDEELKVFVAVKRKTVDGWQGRGEIISQEKVGITAEEISTMKDALSSYKVNGNPQLIMFFYFGWSIEV